MNHPILEPRSKYGYPVLVDPLSRAQRYAAEVRIRKAEKCACAVCKQLIQRITQSRP